MAATVLEAIMERTCQLQAVTAWVREAEKQIADAEAVAASSDARLAPLENQAQAMLQHNDDLDLWPSEILWTVDAWLPAIKYQDGVVWNLTTFTDPQYQKPVLITHFHNSTGKQRVMEGAWQCASLQPSQDDPAHKEPRVVVGTLQSSLTTILNIYYPPAHLAKLLN